MDQEVWCNLCLPFLGGWNLSMFLLKSPPRHSIVACFAVTFERNIAMFLSRHLFLLQSVLHAICYSWNWIYNRYFWFIPAKHFVTSV
jgi:hypothetical protein